MFFALQNVHFDISQDKASIDLAHGAAPCNDGILTIFKGLKKPEDSPKSPAGQGGVALWGPRDI